MSKQELVDKFIGTLERDGDMFFSSGDTDRDYEVIVNTIRNQGYWAGSRLRYFFDEDFNLTHTEGRK